MACAFAVTQRTREIGVRVAIGASRLQIVALVLGDAAAVIAVGLGVGLVLAWNSTQLVTSLLSPASPLTTPPRSPPLRLRSLSWPASPAICRRGEPSVCRR